jgi:hypothetical protein
MSTQTITLPHAFSPREYQLPLLKAIDSGINRAVIVWNRRSGKDKTSFNLMVKKSFERVGTYFYFLPSYSQAKKVIWDNIDNDGNRMLDHIPKEIIKNTNATELKIELVNGSIIQLIGADEFKKSGVGTNPIGVVFSEYSITNKEAWAFVSPILAVNGGWAVFNFTPRGMNHAFELLQRAKENNNWFWEILTINETKVLTGEALEEEKRNNPQDLIDQEYYCKFIEGAGAFFKRVDYSKYDNNDWKVDNLHRYQMGVDLAKYNDYTVITVFDLMSFKVVEQDRFNQIDWNLQKAKIEAMYLKYNKPLTYLDSTGVGDPIYDDLLKKGVNNLVSYKFTEQTRRDLLVNLQLMIEQNKILIPEIYTVLFDELKSFQYALTDSGRIKIQVPEGLHDDTVFSLALSVWATPSKPLPMPNTIRFLNNKKQVYRTTYE